MKIPTKLGHVRLLVDTGATNSILNPNICQPKFITKLNKPIPIRTMTGMLHIRDKASIPNDTFKFPTNTNTEFLITKFHDKFDGLIGMNVLKTCEINLIKKQIKNNGETIPIYFNQQDEDTYENQINHLNSLPAYPEINFTRNLEDNIRISHLNKEEQIVTNKLVRKYSNIFYKDGDDLTFTNQVKHSIPTTNETPIYTRSYRYPEIHKTEVNKQMRMKC